MNSLWESASYDSFAHKVPSSNPSKHSKEKNITQLYKPRSQTENLSSVSTITYNNASHYKRFKKHKCKVYYVMWRPLWRQIMQQNFLLDVFHQNYPNNIYCVYEIVDDHCNQFLASPESFDAIILVPYL